MILSLSPMANQALCCFETHTVVCGENIRIKMTTFVSASAGKQMIYGRFLSGIRRVYHTQRVTQFGRHLLNILYEDPVIIDQVACISIRIVYICRLSLSLVRLSCVSHIYQSYSQFRRLLQNNGPKILLQWTR